MSNIVDRNVVVVLTPEERDRGKFLTEAKRTERCRLALALGGNPVLDANSLPAMEVRPACNVSSRLERRQRLKSEQDAQAHLKALRPRAPSC